MRLEDLPCVADLLRLHPADHFPSQFPVSASAAELGVWLSRRGWHGFVVEREKQQDVSIAGVVFWYGVGTGRISLACAGSREKGLLARAIREVARYLLAHPEPGATKTILEVVVPRKEAELFLEAGFDLAGPVYDPKGVGPPWYLLEARKENFNGRF
jgi:hypothetical protein